jgi:anti-sigma28 factor (negative regulator of flagellin synthesis)
MMGTKQDMKIRTTKARVDDSLRQDKVERARKMIYEGNYAVTNGVVDEILKHESLVPTDVRS